MNLNESFPFAPFEEKWDNLNDLFEASDKALVGIYNSNLIGVCLTNVIISMITSSTILMKHIEEKQKCKALDLCSFMKNIYRCVHKSIPERIDTSKETVGDIIRTGIQMVANNLPYASDYGVCGDYHLFKTYYYNQDLQTKPNEQSAEKFERLIRMNKECSVRDALRWHAILPDVFDLDPNQIKVRQTGNYNLFYYLEINMLSIEFKIGNLPGNQFDNVKPFFKNYHNIVGHVVMNNLREDLSLLTKYPDVLLMSISDSAQFSLHPITINTMVTSLIESYHLSNSSRDIVEKDFPIILVRKHHTVPQLFSNENFTVELPLGGENIEYILTGISITLEAEHIFMFNMISLQQKQPSEKNLTFVDVILTEILSLIKNEEVDAYNFWNNALDYIRGKLMVVYHLVNAYKGDKASEIHAIGLIQQNNQWKLMNDQFSIKIDDIKSFSNMLRFEKTAGFLIERG